MGYRTLRACLNDLEATGQLVRIDEEIDPHLEAAEIQRRVFQAGGPALYFARVKGCRFPMVSNLFGTMDRVRFIFRDYARQRAAAGRAEGRSRPAGPPTVASGRPAAARCGTCGRGACQSRPVLAHETTIDQLAAAAVVARRRRGVHHAAAGLHRRPRPAGLAALEPGHVPRAAFRRPVSSRTARSACTTRSIAASACITRRPFAAASRCAVNVFVGGPPAMSVAAVMPLPEGMSRAGLRRRAGAATAIADDRPRRATADLRRGRLLHHRHGRSRAQAARGTVRRSPGLLQPGARLSRCCASSTCTIGRTPIWPFTVVGRPPQEDTIFGQLIHELTGPVDSRA